MANVCFGDVSDILNAVLRLADVRCFVCKVMKECVSLLQSVADREVFLPTDEIWLYDLQSGLWWVCVCVSVVSEWVSEGEWVSEWVRWVSEWVSEWVVSECNVLWSPELNQLTLSTSVHSGSVLVKDGAGFWKGCGN